MPSIIPACLNEAKDRLVLIDQTLLPNEEKYLNMFDYREIADAIRKLKVRGAPAIGIAAAFGLYFAAKHSAAFSSADMRADFDRAMNELASSRPTAVNLFWAMARMAKRFDSVMRQPIDAVVAALLDESEAIFREDQEMGLAIGRHGLSLLKPNAGVLTHCNAGGLATSGYGTALAPIYLGLEKGYNLRVFADETRPLLQGARLTAYELMKSGVDVTVICDSMASIVMKNGWIDAVMVGCDRIAANGDTANKIGTSGLAILANAYGIPMYILGPTSTIDLNTQDGEAIEIEQRDGEEISNGFGRRTVPEGVKIYNPAFDVTGAAYITAIVTEKGVTYPPFRETLAALF